MAAVVLINQAPRLEHVQAGLVQHITYPVNVDGVVKALQLMRYNVWPDVRHTNMYAFTPGQTICLVFEVFYLSIGYTS